MKQKVPQGLEPIVFSKDERKAKKELEALEGMQILVVINDPHSTKRLPERNVTLGYVSLHGRLPTREMTIHKFSLPNLEFAVGGEYLQYNKESPTGLFAVRTFARVKGTEDKYPALLYK